MQFQRIGFLGCGNMGSALARAAAPKAGDLLLADHAPEKARALAAELGGAAADNGQVARQCDLIFLGVKPQMMAGLLSELGPVLRERSDRFVLVPMAAGLSIAAIRLCRKEEVAPQLTFYADQQDDGKETALLEATIGLHRRYGKNAVMKGMNLLEAGTTRERNNQIGGHRK